MRYAYSPYNLAHWKIMNITIDTSALISVITDEPKKAKIIELTIGANLISPNSVQWEIANAFSAMLKRNRITLSQAQSCITLYQQIPIKFMDVVFIKPLSWLNNLKSMLMTLISFNALYKPKRLY